MNDYVVSTYNKVARTYTDKYFNDTADFPYIDKFLQLLKPGSRILDIGCGPGSFSRYIHEKGFNIEGIDLSEEMLKIAKQKVPNVNFKLMDMRKLDHENNSFDGLLLAYSLIHIPSKEILETLNGFYRVLKPGGFIMTITQAGEPDRVVDEPLKQ